jgi:hypothetical protein
MSAWPPAKEKPIAFQQRQELSTPESPLRRCVVCHAPVTNQNLGGYNGRSALSGDLWCLLCADGRPEQ